MKRRPATDQLPEIIHIEGVLHTLFATPLSSWLGDSAPIWAFDQRTPHCDRGYIGRWEIRDDTLWLINLYAWQNGNKVKVSDLFDGKDEVAADWFSGILVVEPAASEIAEGAAPKTRTLRVRRGRMA